MCWSSPPGHDLKTIVGEKKLYPITYLRRLNAVTKRKLISNEILLLKQLTEINPRELRKRTGIAKLTLEAMIEKSKTILS